MAAKKVFITGATGFIGGSVLNKLLEKHPQLEITALLRSPSSAFSAKYSSVEGVKGSFDDFGIIEKAAHEADIVIHTGDISHPGCAKAILSGLNKRTEESFLIHLTGTGCISDEREQTWEGKYNPHVWDDVKEINEIYDLPETAQHHVIDQWIMDASNEKLKTVIICPPDIYGQSSTIGNRATFLVPDYVEAIIKHKESFYLGSGENIRGVTHIDDVVDLFLLILAKQLEGRKELDYGRQGFYFAVSDGIPWKNAAEKINELGQHQGWLPKGTKAVSWNESQLAALLPSDPGRVLYLWGSNSRAESSRAKKLGWRPHGPSFWEALPEDCKVAAEKLKV
ncbi:NAD(P)-binding protein [Hyaloscypha bicolor E]|uniref:NAD(P)-binding protein n=1 Tax=Hyaloscypha bicolor E TaxID=1095630 RepID=A0A2J6SUH7_9HELO|nr:NAD(P)-binding protein [Hyaloscypha bicolor E]PMD54419.1 NAD(P)-binding protein [Hyaloscypha bicolor E]